MQTILKNYPHFNQNIIPLKYVICSYIYSLNFFLSFKWIVLLIFPNSVNFAYLQIWNNFKKKTVVPTAFQKIIIIFIELY